MWLGTDFLRKTASIIDLDFLSVGRASASLALWVGVSVALASCAKKEAEDASYCAPEERPLGGSTTGVARVFSPDPIVSSGNAFLAPTATNLDDYATEVRLDNLLGTGVLAGKYVDVRDGSVCGGGYGAYDYSARFSYRTRTRASKKR